MDPVWFVISATMLILLHALSTVIYRVCFHPLSKFPGPLLAKVTDLWSAYHNVMGQMHIESYRCHQKYGSIVRFGPNKLSINGVEAISNAYKSEDICKSQVYETLTPAPGAYSSLTLVDKDAHKKRRKVLDQAFSSTALRAFEPTITCHVSTLVGVLDDLILQNHASDWSVPVNMTPMAQYLAYDIMGEFGFGKPFHMQTATTNRFMIDVTEGTLVVAGAYCQYPKLKQYGIGRLVALLGKGTREQYGHMIQDLIKQRLSEPRDSRKDLLHFMTGHLDQADDDTQSVEDNRPFSTDEVWAEGRFLFIAGAETVATVMASTLFYLSRNPDKYQRLTAVIRSTFSGPEDIHSGPLLNQCAYLWACIDETMRISPPFSSVLWREVVSPTFHINGNYVPKGSDIGYSAYSTAHDENIFDRPFDFHPERWLDDGSADASARLEAQQRAFLPFGLGSRKCAGYRLAYLELAIALGKVLWQLDLRRPSTELDNIGAGEAGSSWGRTRVEEYQLFEHLSSRHDGPYLEWRRRADLT